MSALIIASVFAFGIIIGFYTGARFVTPRAKPDKRAVFPSNVIIVDEWKRLDIAPAKRRQKLEVIDVEAK